MKSKVYICHTVFHLFISLLKAMRQRDVEHHIFVPKTLRFNPVSLVGVYLKSANTYPYAEIEKQWFEYKAANPLGFFSYRKKIQQLVFDDFKYNEYDHLFRNADFIVFNDGSPFVTALMLKYSKLNFKLVEDGEAIYTSIKKDTRYLIKLISAYPMPFGQSHFINELEVRFPERLSARIRKKASVLKYDAMVSSLTQKQRDELLSFFNVSESIIENKERLILLTQPLSEDGLVSEAYKRSLYQRIVDEQIGDMALYIKPHPRELTDYKQLYPEAHILSPESPVELLSFLSCHFDVAVTYFSTSIHSVEAKRKVYLSLDYDQKVKSSWLKYMGVRKINR